MFDLDALGKAVADHGPVARVVIGAVKGSSPREVGASMHHRRWRFGMAGGGAGAGDAGRGRHTAGP
jgi:xanthine dehydrogenase accessory factor